MPEYQTAGASGMDIAACAATVVPVRGRQAVHTGVFLELPPGMEVQVRPRSGLALRHGIGILNSPGTIDSDYRGEIVVILFNVGRVPFVVRPGDRIAQLVFARAQQVRLRPALKLGTTQRGEGGFGHTGTMSRASAATRRTRRRASKSPAARRPGRRVSRSSETG
jgi:dUTP pyrophosphatase